MSDLTKTKRKINRRPKLKACLVFWDDDKKRFRMTTPKTAQAASKFGPYDTVFLLTDKLEPRFKKDIELFQLGMAGSEVGMTCTQRGRVTFDDLLKIA